MTTTTIENITPLQVLCRARERVQAGTHLTAHAAIEVPRNTGPRAETPYERAWVALLAASAPALTPTGIGQAAALYAASEGPLFPTAQREKELGMLGRAILAAKKDPERAGILDVSSEVVALLVSNLLHNVTVGEGSTPARAQGIW